MNISTITGKEAKLVRQYNTSEIIKKYSEELTLDVNRFFKSSDLNLYQCADTGYKFFSPEQLSGDGKFYEELQRFEWYYIPWKWEHEIAVKYIRSGYNVLEVGCGQGGFLKKITEKKNTKITGLELNKDAVTKLTRQGYTVYNRLIQEYSKNAEEKFDIVCSFQVLEHIYDVGSFFGAMVDCLKQDGHLIIAVPNNDSFIKYDEGGVLNFPPHHMGWWTKDTLIKLGDFFKLKAVACLYEPLQDYHYDWYLHLLGKRAKSVIFLSFLYEKIARPILKMFLKLKIFKPRGHSIIIVYKK